MRLFVEPASSYSSVIIQPSVPPAFVISIAGGFLVAMVAVAIFGMLSKRMNGTRPSHRTPRKR